MNFASRTVVIAAGLSPALPKQAHPRARPHGSARRHRIRAGCRGQAEIEAESVAYIPATHAGFTTAAYSLGYVAH